MLKRGAKHTPIPWSFSITTAWMTKANTKNWSPFCLLSEFSLKNTRKASWMREHLCKQKSSILQHVWQNMISVAFDTLSYSGISYFVHVSTYLSLFLKEMVSLQISVKSLSDGQFLQKWFCGCEMMVKKWYHTVKKCWGNILFLFGVCGYHGVDKV